jgi:hypothetical protein
MAWKKRFSFTATFVFETDSHKVNLIKDIAKNYTDEAFKHCKELEAELFKVEFNNDLEILYSTSQTVGDPAYKPI